MCRFTVMRFLRDAFFQFRLPWSYATVAAHPICAGKAGRGDLLDEVDRNRCAKLPDALQVHAHTLREAIADFKIAIEPLLADEAMNAFDDFEDDVSKAISDLYGRLGLPRHG